MFVQVDHATANASFYDRDIGNEEVHILDRSSFSP
jgi:hypothetical protein